jgi:hypothetical protein
MDPKITIKRSASALAVFDRRQDNRYGGDLRVDVIKKERLTVRAPDALGGLPVYMACKI